MLGKHSVELHSDPSNTFKTLSQHTKPTWSLVHDWLFWDSGFKGKHQCGIEQRQQTALKKGGRQPSSEFLGNDVWRYPPNFPQLDSPGVGGRRTVPREQEGKCMGLKEQEIKYLWAWWFLEPWAALIDSNRNQLYCPLTSTQRRHVNELNLRIPSEVAGQL